MLLVYVSKHTFTHQPLTLLSEGSEERVDFKYYCRAWLWMTMVSKWSSFERGISCRERHVIFRIRMLCLRFKVNVVQFESSAYSRNL